MNRKLGESYPNPNINPDCPEFDTCFDLHIAMSDEEREEQVKEIYNKAIAQLKDGTPMLILTETEINDLKENVGIVVNKDTGVWWFWDTSIEPNKYVSSNRAYLSSSYQFKEILVNNDSFDTLKLEEINTNIIENYDIFGGIEILQLKYQNGEDIKYWYALFTKEKKLGNKPINSFKLSIYDGINKYVNTEEVSFNPTDGTITSFNNNIDGNFANVNGYYEKMTVGYALGIVDPNDGEPINRTFAIQVTANETNIEKGLAIIKEIGGNTIVNNGVLENAKPKILTSVSINLCDNDFIKSGKEFKSKEFFRIIPNKKYALANFSGIKLKSAIIQSFDKEKKFVNYYSFGAGCTATPSVSEPNVYYCKVVIQTLNDVPVLDKFVLSIEKKALEYTPYKKDFINIPFEKWFTEGFMSGVNNARDKIIFNKENKATIKKETNLVDFASLNFIPQGGADTGKYWAVLADVKRSATEYVIPNIICNKYQADTQQHVQNKTQDKTVGVYYGESSIIIYDSALVGKTTSEVKAYFDEPQNKTYLVYEIAEPIIKQVETIQDYSYLVENKGFEYWDSEVPTYTSIVYKKDLVGKIADFPNPNTIASKEEVEIINKELNITEKTPLLKEEVDRVNALNVMNNGVLSFAFMTDVHVYQVFAKNQYKYNILNRLAKTMTLDFVSCGGDMIGGYKTKREVITQLSNYAKDVMDGINVPYLICKGNHDGFGENTNETNPKNDVLTKEEWFRIAGSWLGNEYKTDTQNPFGGYFYKDFNNAKIRVIVLNTNDYPDNLLENGNYFPPLAVLIRQRQLDWLSSEALRFEDNKRDWSVLILSHAAINPKEDGGLNAKTLIEGILYAYMNGTTFKGSEDRGYFKKTSVDVDFTQQGRMEFIGAVCGHMHYDRITTFETLNRPNISVGCALLENGTPTESGATKPERNTNDITAELADLITIDTKNRKIKMVRYGAGNDREVNY